MISAEPFLELLDVGSRLNELETPVPIVDLDIVERNVAGWQARCDKLGIANRPHIKTHKIAGLARYQIACGAKGITVQKLGEAECMAEAGIRDMLLTFNVVGPPKIARLARLVEDTGIVVVADNAEMLAGLQWSAERGGRVLNIFVECDTGAGRNGVQTPGDAARLAQTINTTAGLRFGGLMTYPAAGQRLATQRFLSDAKAACTALGLDVPVVTSGGTPDMFVDEGLEGVTEYRVGTSIYNDRSLVARGTCTFADCAVKVLATVVSVPTDNRAIVDAGTKALTSDLMGLTGFGTVEELGTAPVYAANEEHGFIDISQAPSKPRVGGLVHILPNHVCPVSNLFDSVVFVRGDRVLGAAKVDARGLVQ
jgi:D-serine deaminase-like pyridoxal phosphate-dependent protein